MKRYLTCVFCFILAFQLSSQEYFSSADKFPSVVEKLETDKFYVFELDTNASLLEANRSSSLEFDFLLPNGENVELLMEENILFDNESTVYVSSSRGVSVVSLESLNFLPLKGYVSGNSENIARLLISDDGLYGFFEFEKSSWYVEPIRSYDKSLPNNLVILYNSDDVAKQTHAMCGVTHMIGTKEAGSEFRGSTCHSVDLGMAIDFSMFEKYGSISSAIQQTLGVLNNASANFESSNANFDNAIHFNVRSYFISSCLNCDPWTNTTYINGLLSEFRAWGVQGGFNTTVDMGQLWSNRDFDGNAVGLAYTSGNLVCNQQAYHLIQDWTSSADHLRMTTAHEIAHNLGAPHVSESGFIMSPAVSDSDVWNQTTKDRINYNIGTYFNSCLSNCGQQNCEKVSDLDIIADLNDTGFHLQWAPTGASQYEVKVYNEEGTNILYENVFQTSHASLNNHGFIPCNSYVLTIEPLCSNQDNPITKTSFVAPSSSGCVEFESNSSIGWSYSFIQFSDKTEGASSWYWDFGDGGFSNEREPVYSYSAPGTYDVSLTVNGTDTKTKVGFVKILPDKLADYTVSNGGDFDSNMGDFGADCIEGRECIFELGQGTGFLNSSSNVWKTILHENIPSEGNISALYSPRFDMTLPGVYTIEFDMGMERQFCNAPFAAQMHYSLNDGLSWVRLGSYGDSGPNIEGWYDSGPSDNCPIKSTVFADQTGWSFKKKTRHKSYDITFLAGNSSVVFRWVTSIDGTFPTGFNIDGVMIDNFELKMVGSTTGTGGSALPLDILEFIGNKVDDQIELEWITANEIDMSHFVIEKLDRDNKFIAIGEERAANESSKVGYDFIDPYPVTGENVYRLKMVEFSGDFEYSEIVAVDYLETRNDEIIIYPTNIVDGTLHFRFLGDLDEPLMYTLVTADGKVLKNREFLFDPSVQRQFSLDISSFPKGVYFIKVSTSRRMITTKKIIIQY